MRDAVQENDGGSVVIAGGQVEAAGSMYDCDGIGSNEESVRLARLSLLGGTVLSTGGYAEFPHSISADTVALGADRMVSYSHMQSDPQTSVTVTSLSLQSAGFHRVHKADGPAAVPYRHNRQKKPRDDAKRYRFIRSLGKLFEQPFCNCK